MVLKIKRQDKTEVIECDRVEYREVEATDTIEKQVFALCWKNDKVIETAFKFAYLMEHGKTIDTIGLTAEQA